MAEVIAEANFETSKKFKRIGIPDEFADEYGSQDTLLERYSISANYIVSVILGFSNSKRMIGTQVHT